LQRDYAATIRQLVPQYDEMVDCAVTELTRFTPTSILDVGAGNGAVTALIASWLPDAHVTALDASAEMARDATQRLAHVGQKLRVVCADIDAYQPNTPLDAIFSNLALHNIPVDRKLALLEQFAAWLHPRGVFVWGDLIRCEDAEQQRRRVEQRRTFALEAGCDPALVELNFRKEGSDDHPQTVKDMHSLAIAAGFHTADTIWTHDTFAILRTTVGSA
jgi:cyclopropane fatty-acyl-phospholipid synthase-like methyltransferase